MRQARGQPRAGRRHIGAVRHRSLTAGSRRSLTLIPSPDGALSLTPVLRRCDTEAGYSTHSADVLSLIAVRDEQDVILLLKASRGRACRWRDVASTCGRAHWKPSIGRASVRPALRQTANPGLRSRSAAVRRKSQKWPEDHRTQSPVPSVAKAALPCVLRLLHHHSFASPRPTAQGYAKSQLPQLPHRAYPRNEIAFSHAAFRPSDILTHHEPTAPPPNERHAAVYPGLGVAPRQWGGRVISN